jgi:hypothetical protein
MPDLCRIESHTDRQRRPLEPSQTGTDPVRSSSAQSIRVTCPCCACTHFSKAANLIECERGDQAARKIHMDFIRTTRGIGAQFADPAQPICS